MDLSPGERKALAASLNNNPLFRVMLDELEGGAIERMVYAETDLGRLEAQKYVKAARSFREDCEAYIATPLPGGRDE